MTDAFAADEPLEGRYRLAEVIGRGGMGTVYRAVDLRLERPVAVKLLNDDAAASSDRRFLAEVRALAGFVHPNLVRLLDAGESGGRRFLVMDLVRGESLAARLRRGPLPAREARDLLAGIADALGYVHRRQVVHRDVKPANILVGEDGAAFLADFGIARLLDSTVLTATGIALGTPAYLAPEQVHGDEVGPPADVYALGLVLLESLTGERAFPGTPAEAVAARLTRRPAVPEELGPWWGALIGAMTAPSPDARPSAALVAERLRDPQTPEQPPGREPATMAAGLDTVALEAVPTAPVAIPTAPVAIPTAPVAIPTAPVAIPTAPVAIPPTVVAEAFLPGATATVQQGDAPGGHRRGARRRGVAAVAVGVMLSGAALAGVIGSGVLHPGRAPGASAGDSGTSGASGATQLATTPPRTTPGTPDTTLPTTTEPTTTEPATTTTPPTTAPPTSSTPSSSVPATTAPTTPPAPAPSSAPPSPVSTAAEGLERAISQGVAAGAISAPAGQQLLAETEALASGPTSPADRKAFDELVRTMEADARAGGISASAIPSLSAALQALAGPLGIGGPTGRGPGHPGGGG